MTQYLLRNVFEAIHPELDTRPHPESGIVGSGNITGDDADSTYAHLTAGQTSFQDPALTYAGVDQVWFTLDQLDPALAVADVTSLALNVRCSFTNPGNVEYGRFILPIPLGSTPSPNQHVTISTTLVKGDPLGDSYIAALVPALQTDSDPSRVSNATFARIDGFASKEFMDVYDVWIDIETAELPAISVRRSGSVRIFAPAHR